MNDRDLQREFVRPLAAWFDREARDLPWRRNRSGYAALVSEAMLQQTQVARVVEKYVAFMQRFPDVRALAAADEQDVLAMWQGLGYYRRARHLHAAAQMIVDEHDGEVPRDAATLQTLPGVGRYTAGAVASIAFGARAPIVDGNVQRVAARFTGALGDDAAWSFAEQIVDLAEDPGVVNEAVMELGALVCTPRGPKCPTCPVRDACFACAHNRQEEIPPPKPAAKQKAVVHHVVIVRDADDRVRFEQRPADGMWSNMWQATTVESPKPLSNATLRKRLGLPIGRLRTVESFTHQTTHRRVEFRVFETAWGGDDPPAGEWRAPDATADLPLSNPQRRIVEMFT